MAEQKATTTAADGGGKVVAPMPFMQNGCFLCGLEIGETDPRQFYTGPAGSTGTMMLAHTGCLNKFMANGEQWPEEPKPEAVVKLLADHPQHILFGKAKMSFSSNHLELLCQDAIAEHGLKAVLPALIAALKAIEEALP